MSGPFDPVAVLALTGNVFEAVGRILTSTEHSHGASPKKFREPRR
jgi:hypothetical protein